MSDENHRAVNKNPAASTESLILTPAPPIRGWVIVHVTQDYCLHLASTFPEWTVLQYGDVDAPDPETRSVNNSYTYIIIVLIAHTVITCLQGTPQYMRESVPT